MKFKKNEIYICLLNDNKCIYTIKSINNKYIQWEDIYPHSGNSHGYNSDDIFFSYSYKVEDDTSYKLCFEILFK